MCTCYPAPTLSCAPGLRTSTGGEEQKLRCPRGLLAGARMRSRAHAVASQRSLPSGLVDPVSLSGSLTQGAAGNALALMGQGLCSAMKMTS